MDDVAALLDAFLDELLPLRYGALPVKPSELNAGKAILGLRPEAQVKALRAMLADDRFGIRRLRYEHYAVVEKLRGQLLRRSLPLTSDDVDALAAELVPELSLPDLLILGAIERWAKTHELPAKTAQVLDRLAAEAEKEPSADARKAGARARALLRVEEFVKLESGEAWADQAIVELCAMDGDDQDAWRALLAHCQSASGGKPSAKWIAEAERRVEAVGRERFRAAAFRWFPLVDRPRTAPIGPGRGADEYHAHRITEAHALLLKGMVWLLGTLAEPADDDAARLLGALAVSAYRKLPGSGPRLVALGNACVWALGALPGTHGLHALAVLKTRVKYGTARKGVEKALDAVAARMNVPRDEIEELSVPTYGLTGVGVLERKLGDHDAVLAVSGTATTLSWRPRTGAGPGKTLKSVPKAVRERFGAELRELRSTAKDLQKMLAAQRERLDTLFLAQRSWPLETWRSRYADHPLVGALARQLIWTFTRADGTAAAAIPIDGDLVGVDGAAVPVGDDATVTLWHPIDRGVEEVVAWRRFLEEREITQPFKQAHREIYRLTDAERTTRVYSNRFAAHILKQHQFNALCGARGWRNSLRLMVDADCPPTQRDLPAWGLRAEYWVEGAGDDWRVHSNDAGVYLCVATDQVRFYPIGAKQLSAHAAGGGYHWSRDHGANEPAPTPLEEIPAIVFSEVMRDVDLFVGVASIGNDPTWADRGDEVAIEGYWRDYAFGALSEASKTRRGVLERLVPRLKIADRCHFDERHLVVRGNVRTYRIHIGSGNILMEPNDEYLCIIATGSAGKVFLPFEGDRTLSIVLSKALLLAQDDRITDPTILTQIQR